MTDYNAMADDDFRKMLNDWLVENYPDELRFPAKRMHWDQCGDWYMTLANKGWLAPGWPAEHGGMGLDVCSSDLMTGWLKTTPTSCASRQNACTGTSAATGT